MAGHLAAAPAQSDLFQIKGVEIFRVGEWNGDEYTTEDLDAMVAAFPKQGFGVPLKLGHDDTPGLPASGWVSAIYRQGDVLKADFKDLTRDVYASVLDHQYDHVSCEIYWNLKRDGATYTRALKAVALLGAETPAVNGLQPLREATFKSSDFEKVTHASLQVVSRQMADQNPNPELVKALKESTDAFAALSAKLADVEKAREADKTAAAAAMKAYTDQVAAMKSKQVADDISKRADSCKMPALKAHIGHLYEFALTDGATRVAKFTDDKGATVEKSMSAILDEVVTHINKFAESRVGTLSGGKLTVVPKDGGDYADASAELTKRANEYVAKNSLKGAEGFATAMTACLKADDELATRYAAERRGVAV